ncbi:MAG: YDG domain-containing protein [Patescibacteria group bacterium]|nr:YDG domain-containing protein [Patescibacteria group bacterium]
MKKKLLLFMGIVVLFFFVLSINSTKAASYKKYTGIYKGTWKTYDIICSGIYKKKHKTSKVILKVKKDGSLTGKWKIKGSSYKKVAGVMKKKNIRLRYPNLSTTYDFIGTINNGKLKVIAFNNDASSKRRCLLGWKEKIVAKKKLTISDPTLTLSKIYDGTTTAQVTAGSLIGAINSNNVTVSATATYDTADAGVGKTITVVYTLAGTDASNYIKPANYIVSTGVITQNQQITQLTISDPTLTLSKAYDTTTTASVTPGSLSGVIGADDVTVSAIANYDTADVGVGKTITVSYTLVGSDAPNYIKPTDYIVATGEITIAPINISAIDGITVPVKNETPDTTVAESAQFTGSTTWLPTNDPYWPETIYTATITLTAKTNYTLTGVSADFFTVAGSSSTTNSADSGVVTAVFPATSAMAVGDYYQGGKIAYHDGTGHGFISALSNQGTSTWGCAGTDIPGADGTAIGTGSQNTADMVASLCTGAAQLAYDVTINGYDDWYLPSKDELNQLYINRFTIGGFTSNFYWSSSEYSSSNAWRQDFSSGDQSNINKENFNSFYVRAIRTF